MNNVIIFILIGLLIVPYLIAYYYDYKSNPKQFSSSFKVDLVDLKKLLRWIFYFLILIGGNYLYKTMIPFNKDHGIVFNQEREKIGLPILDETWYLDEDRDEQFTTIYWRKNNVQNGHFKKVNDYTILGLKTETNYYKNPKYPENFNGTIYAWSIFDFSSKAMTYHMDNPNYEISFKPKQEKIIEISQETFDMYLLK